MSVWNFQYAYSSLKQLQRQLLAVHVVLASAVQLVGQVRTTVLRLMERQAAFLAAKQLPGRALQVRFAALFTRLGLLIYRHFRGFIHLRRLIFEFLQQGCEGLKLPDFCPQPVIQSVFYCPPQLAGILLFLNTNAPK